MYRIKYMYHLKYPTASVKGNGIRADQKVREISLAETTNHREVNFCFLAYQSLTANHCQIPSAAC
jgi:hypothetical protein